MDRQGQYRRTATTINPQAHQENGCEMEREGAGATITALFDPAHLPADLFPDVNTDEIIQSIQYTAYDVLRAIVHTHTPSLGLGRTCQNQINGRQASRTEMDELSLGVKLSLIGYALPHFLSGVSSRFHLRNANFSRFITSLVTENGFLGYENMDDILQGRCDSIELPSDAQIAGFYVRTPIRITDRRGQPITRIPRWPKRDRLLKHRVQGDVNVYVLRQNLPDSYECYVLFRGSSNEFNGIPQYGRNMDRTQIYAVPDHDPLTREEHAGGSPERPLFFRVYADMVSDAMPHILEALHWLQAMDPHCSRIVVAGHSMGGAMVQVFCYLLRLQHPDVWEKCVFRAVGSPLIANATAVQQMEQWVIDSRQTNKYIEVVNRDDFVNALYHLGGRGGVTAAAQEGVKSVGEWVVHEYFRQPRGTSASSSSLSSTDLLQQVLQILRERPDLAVSSFLSGVFRAQSRLASPDKTASVRLGQRPEEVPLWGQIDRLYQGTLRLVYCERPVDWSSEYVGKAHTMYGDCNMSALWSSIRLYEDNLYRYYAEHSLQENNKLRIIPLFPAADLPRAIRLVRERNAK